MSQMTDIILSQWVIAAALGAFCIGLVVFCLVPALYLAARLRTMKTSLEAAGDLARDPPEHRARDEQCQHGAP